MAIEIPNRIAAQCKFSSSVALGPVTANRAAVGAIVKTAVGTYQVTLGSPQGGLARQYGTSIEMPAAGPATPHLVMIENVNTSDLVFRVYDVTTGAPVLSDAFGRVSFTSRAGASAQISGSSSVQVADERRAHVRFQGTPLNVPSVPAANVKKVVGASSTVTKVANGQYRITLDQAVDPDVTLLEVQDSSPTALQPNPVILNWRQISGTVIQIDAYVSNGVAYVAADNVQVDIIVGRMPNGAN